jgi:multidrug efflux pump subunit AcrA (membrane-fusion protein)
VLKLKVMHRVRVQAKVPGRYAGEVRVGTPVVITAGTKTRTGKVSSVFPVQDSTTRTFIVEAIVDNSDSNLQPGAFVNVELQASRSTEGITVRNDSIHEDSAGNHFVWVLKERQSVGATDWTCTMHPEISEKGPGICPICKMDLTPRETTARFIAARKPVVTGNSNASVTVIVNGLKAGDQVIFGGADDLVEGSPVAPVPWGESGPSQLPAGSGHEQHG